MRRIGWIVLAAVLPGALSCGGGGLRITEAESLEQAKALAAQRGALIVLDFYTDG
jgi:hypothetical protein